MPYKCKITLLNIVCNNRTVLCTNIPSNKRSQRIQPCNAIKMILSRIIYEKNLLDGSIRDQLFFMLCQIISNHTEIVFHLTDICTEHLKGVY